MRGNVTCQEILTVLGVLSLKKRCLRDNMATGCKNTKESQQFILHLHGDKREGMRNNLLSRTKQDLG